MDEDLKKSIETLIKVQNNSNSLGWTFLRGIFSGFGVFVGSGILVALLIYILSFFNTIPYLGQYISDIVDVAKRGTN